jgi:hypothetical protein
MLLVGGGGRCVRSGTTQRQQQMLRRGPLARQASRRGFACESWRLQRGSHTASHTAVEVTCSVALTSGWQPLQAVASRGGLADALRTSRTAPDIVTRCCFFTTVGSFYEWYTLLRESCWTDSPIRTRWSPAKKALDAPRNGDYAPWLCS